MKSRWYKVVAAIMVCLVCSPAVWAASGYRELDTAPPPDNGKIVVAEFFWYGCPHCYRFEPMLEQWAKKQPADVDVRHVPAVLSQRWAIHARAFYAAKALGVLDQFHHAMFKAMHQRGESGLATRKAIGQFVDSLGLDGDAFVSAMDSLGVDTRMKRARDLQQAYGIRGTPTVVIDGRYLTSGNLAGGFPRMLEIMEQRVAAVRRARQ